MANTAGENLVDDPTPTTDDYLLSVNDPAGTPASRFLKISNFLPLLISNVNIQIFTANGTYTPNTNMKKCLLIAVGAGGAGVGGTGTDTASGGGGGGGTAIKLVANSVIGSAQTVTIGIGATAVAGTNTSVGIIVLATGGSVGVEGGSTTLGTGGAGGVGGVGSNSDLNIVGEAGARSVLYSTTLGEGGNGGRSLFGGAGRGGSDNTPGNTGGLYGGGGGGGHASGTPDIAGGAGANGVVYIIEFT